MMDDAFLKAFAEVVRGQLAHKCDVELEGVGTFKPVHKKQYQKRFTGGRLVMMPPKDRIKFIPQSR